MFLSSHTNSMSSIEDLDFSEYDAKAQHTFVDTYSAFIKKRSTDCVKVGTGWMTRANARDMLKKGENDDVITKLRDNLKQVEVNNLSVRMDDPHELLGLRGKTSVQKLVDKHVPFLSMYGAFAYSCSCGSGKTIAGLQVMQQLQCRTLIISSRNAVNDQWKVIIEQLYPDLVIECKRIQYRRGKRLKPNERIDDPDVYIDTPQYLGKKIDSLTMHPSLIIFDEVHSLLGNAFIRVLLYPLLKVTTGEWDEMPYMIALSATYPPATSKGYKSLVKLFGKAFRTESSITDIPVYVWDYYDHYTVTVTHPKTNAMVEVTGQEARGAWDMKYRALEDHETIEYFADAIDGVNEEINTIIANKRKANKGNGNGSQPGNPKQTASGNQSTSAVGNASVNQPDTTASSNGDDTGIPHDSMHDHSSCSEEDLSLIDPTDVHHKGIIITHSVDLSAYAAMYAHLRWNVNVLLIRAVDEDDLYIPFGNSDTYELTCCTTYDDIVRDGVGIKCDYKEHIDDVSIIVGTYHRLKEGFSVQNITWGICTKYVWSYISRVQMTGRIRRSSDDPELNARKRILMVSSTRRPSNLRVPNAKKPFKWMYDFEIEKSLFEFENYIKI